MSHLPPLVLYLYPDGLEFGGWWRRLLFCHWLKAVNLIEQKNTDKNRQKNLWLEPRSVDRPGVCTHRACWHHTGGLAKDGHEAAAQLCSHLRSRHRAVSCQAAATTCARSPGLGMAGAVSLWHSTQSGTMAPKGAQQGD